MSNPNPQNQFKPGDSKINRNGRPKEEWTWSGLLKELADELDGKTGLEKKKIIANALFKQAFRGNVMAIKEFGDRIDGKAPQSTDITSKGEKLEGNKIIFENFSDATKSK